MLITFLNIFKLFGYASIRVINFDQHLGCVQEQVQVEGAMAEKIKASDANAEAAEAGMLKFSKAVVDMSEKINAKMDRIKALKAKLQALQHDVQTMELGSERAGGKGKTSPAKMLSNIRTKCMQEAAELSDVEVEENHELLHGVSRARKVAISMQEKSIQLSRRLSMEVKRAPNFSNEKLCKANGHVPTKKNNVAQRLDVSARQHGATKKQLGCLGGGAIRISDFPKNLKPMANY